MVVPNPSNGLLTVSFYLPAIDDGIAELCILDLLGRNVYSSRLTGIVVGENDRTFALPLLQSGNYILRVTGKQINAETLLTIKN